MSCRVFGSFTSLKEFGLDHLHDEGDGGGCLRNGVHMAFRVHGGVRAHPEAAGARLSILNSMFAVFRVHSVLLCSRRLPNFPKRTCLCYCAFVYLF